MDDPHNLSRFLNAQEPVIPAVERELAEGAKRSHWMWFVFPQVRGLGSSSTSRHYAIRSAEEARAYLDHPLLGPRLRKWTETVLGVEGRSAKEIFGYPDYLKFHSSMTLFAMVAEEASPFERALQKYYEGSWDEKTVAILESE